MSEIYIGIDNGLSGGIAFLSGYHGKLIAAYPMPTLLRSLRGKSKGKARKSREIDGWVLADRIYENCANRETTTVVIEECPEHARDKSAMRSMAISYGIIVGAISAVTNCKIVPVRSGNPADSWQREMLGNVKDTKAAALAKARQFWPEETWLATPRSKVPHMGLVDAALIAEYGRINKL